MYLKLMAIESFLEKGEDFLKRPEANSLPLSLRKCTLKVDEDGLFLLWQYISQKELCCVEIAHIHEVKTGIASKDAKSMIDTADGDSPKQILTIYHGFEISSLSVLQFLASSAETAQKWEIALKSIVHSLKLRHLSPLEVTKKQWKRLQYSLNSKGMIPIRRLVKQFAHDKNEKAIVHKLKACGFPYSKNDEISPKELTFEAYKKICHKICTRNDLADIFHDITKKRNDYIELQDFIAWLNKNQRDPRLNEILVPTYDEKQASAIIKKYERNSKHEMQNRLSLQGFSDYLSSEDNPLVCYDHVQLHQDMDRPLSHYFINSSHNTYLTGRQIRGKSSLDIYRHVLLAGCRCVELDCWDGKGEYHGEPIVTHGKAMCTDVLFKSVLYAIKDSAFVVSEYPVILSFETHCSKPLQLKMSHYCEEVFGDMLLNKNLETHPLLPGVPLPSPNALKRKILIKNKRLQPEIEKAQLEELQTTGIIGAPTDNDEVEGEEAHPELKLNKIAENAADSVKEPKSPEDSIPKSPASPTPIFDNSKTKVSLKKSATEDEESDIVPNYEYVKPSSTNIHPCLSAIVNYCQSVKFPGFKKIEDGSQKLCCQMSSFSESVGLNYVKSNAIELVNYNKNQLSRIYPRGNRVDSSNYMPQIFWNVGCQMVSLNFQTHDLGEQLNAAKFEYNGRCGYLLKPEMMLSETRTFDPFAESTVDGVIAAQCDVKVISAQFLADKPVSSHVEVDMYGLPNDTIRKEFRTNLVVGNGLNPIYNNEFSFRKVIFPDLALLRFTLYDDSRQLIGQRVIPLISLQTGYRYVCLRSPGGLPLDSTMIFVKISLRSYVPDSFLMIANALENPKAHQMSLLKQHEQQLKRLEDDADEVASGDTCDGGHPPVRRTTSTEASNGESKANNRSSVKRKETTSKTPLARESSAKKPDTDSFEAESVSLQTLVSHPIYVKAARSHKKQALKAVKSQDSLRLRRAEVTDTSDPRPRDRPKASCCVVPSFVLRRGKKTQPKASTEPPPIPRDDSSFASLSPELEKEALLAALNAIHVESIDKLKEMHKREKSEMEQSQTKQWMEKAKVIRKDKTIPITEKKRRLKEKNNQEVKKFMEERQRLLNKHHKQLERMKSFQVEEVERITSEATSDC